MHIRINSAESLGKIVRAARKDQRLRQDDAAGSVGVSENFLAKLERGGETVQLGKVLRVLEELGIRLSADVTESVAARLDSPDGTTS